MSEGQVKMKISIRF